MSVERDGIDVVAKREDILALLTRDRLQKPEIVDGLNQSRSTVDRAIRELAALDFVVRTRNGY
jgi:predicted transcriptional regulator